MARAPSIKIGDLVARVEAPTVPFRVTSKLAGGGWRVLPWRRSGGELALISVGSIWTDGSSVFVKTGRS